jgi:hypothetical protein
MVPLCLWPGTHCIEFGGEEKHISREYPEQPLALFYASGWYVEI